MTTRSVFLSGSRSAILHHSPNTAASRGGGKFLAGGWHRILLIGLLLAVVMMAAPVAAATITVAADGTGDYTTIEAAVAASAAGDTIFIKAGSYSLSTTVHVSNSGVTIKGEGSDKVLVNSGIYSINIDGNGDIVEDLTFAGNAIALSSGSSNCIIKNNTFLNLNSGAIGIASSYNQITDNIIIKPSSYGISTPTSPATAFNIIKNNTIVDSSATTYGIYLYSSSSLVEHNTVRDGTSAGIYIRNANNTIIKNFFYQQYRWRHTLL